jgi:hydroxyacylglutathione hydrolase
MRNWTTPGGYRIFQVLSGRSNVFLLTNGKADILVDTGPGFMWKTLLERLGKLHVNKIDLLILTHSHFDHAANAANIREKYNARVIIHKSETGYLTSGDNILPSGTNSFTKFLVRTFEGKFRSVALYQPCKYDYAIDDIFELSDFGFNAYLMHTPGHTEGSVSVITDNEIALVGDTMFGVFWWTAFPPFASDPGRLLKSWEKLLKTGCRLFIPSHGSANSKDMVEKDLLKRTNIKLPY